MSSPFIGEIRMFGGNFAPRGWAFCNGQLLSIGDNTALFSLLGTTYGGDGQTTFALPDLRGRVPVHMGQGPGLSNYIIGQSAGTETVTVTVNQMPQHNHPSRGQSNSGTQSSPANGVWAASNLSQYSANNADSTMNPQSIGFSGGSQPHDNMLPFQCISFIIALEGIFPSRN